MVHSVTNISNVPCLTVVSRYRYRFILNCCGRMYTLSCSLTGCIAEAWHQVTVFLSQDGEGMTRPALPVIGLPLQLQFLTNLSLYSQRMQRVLANQRQSGAGHDFTTLERKWANRPDCSRRRTAADSALFEERSTDVVCTVEYCKLQFASAVYLSFCAPSEPSL